MKTFHLKVIACDKIFYDDEAISLIFDTTDGEMTIMAGHEEMTTVVEIGDLKIRTPDNNVITAIVSDGFLKCAKNNVNVIVYSAETPEEIDAFRAAAAKERAQEQMSQKQSMIEYKVSQASMARAMARIRGRDKYVDRQRNGIDL